MKVDNKNRYSIVDFVRGFAVGLMIFFHFFYDLAQFNFVDIDFFKDPFWFGLPRLIVTLFLFSVGVSLGISHRGKFKRTPFIKRLIKIGSGAILISISTYFMFPKSWVYFGTLHCIFFCTILATPLLNHPRVSLGLGLLILGFDLAGMRVPFFEMDHAAMDYIPIFPWLSLTLIGIYAHSIKFHTIKIPDWSIVRGFNFMGRYALRIYIIHQPVLYGLVFLAYKIVN